MARKSKAKIVCEFFTWSLFRRGGVFYADGRRNQPNLGKHSLGTRDEAEAMAVLRKLDRQKAIEFQRAEPEAERRSDDLLVRATWDRYLDYVARPDVLGGAGPRTQARYRAVRDKHVGLCKRQGVVSWNQVDQKHIEAYGAFLAKQKYADATIYLECTLLKQVVKWLIDDDKTLPDSQRIRLSLRRSQETSTYCFSRAQVRGIVEFCVANSELHWLGDVIVALATTGMRIGELAALRWTDVDLDNGVITLHDTRHSGRHAKAGAVRTLKGRRGRRLPIHPRLHQVLERMAHRSDGHIFGMPRGGPLLPNGVCKIFIRAVIKPLMTTFPTPKGEVGFAHGRIHSFRHAFVSQAFLDRASEGEIREWVGHTNSRIVERYRHLGMEDARRKMDNINFLGDAPSPEDPHLDTVCDKASKDNQVGQHQVGQHGQGRHGIDEQGGADGPGVPDRKYRDSTEADAATKKMADEPEQRPLLPGPICPSDWDQQNRPSQGSRQASVTKGDGKKAERGRFELPGPLRAH